MATTTSNPPRLLDITRLSRRAGRAMTGVDRVEFAYLQELLNRDAPVFGLVRSRLGYLLLSRDGLRAFQTKLRAKDEKEDRDSVERYLRAHSIARCLPFRLRAMLTRHLPQAIHYVNVGHSNLTDRVISAVSSLPGSRSAVLIHDTIPLDTPEFQRPETAAKFRRFLLRATNFADLLICNSEQTRRDVLRHAPQAHGKQFVTAHLGVPIPVPGKPPSGVWDGQPYFVTLGTIEPRKNHALLLDIWEDVAPAHLLICGHRGWRNEAVFDRLDAKPDRVTELPGLSDAEVFGLMENARGLLFPSFAEGYGLPPVEAAALGVPVLCNNLDIYREVLGDIPVYASVDDRYLWTTTIKALIHQHQANRPVFEPPSWDSHFKAVLTLI